MISRQESVDGEVGHYRVLARPERFELPTYSSGGCRSIQLSYGRVISVYIARQVSCRRERQCAKMTYVHLAGASCAASFQIVLSAVTSGARDRVRHHQLFRPSGALR
jgi:hypothetical protein